MVANESTRRWALRKAFEQDNNATSKDSNTGVIIDNNEHAQRVPPLNGSAAQKLFFFRLLAGASLSLHCLRPSI